MMQNNERRIWDLDICKNFELLKSADIIIIYGAADKGKDIFCWLKDAGIRIDFFCDIDRDKWGNYIENVEIISPFEIKNIGNHNKTSVYILACIEYPRELLKLLERINMTNIHMVTYWGIKTALNINAEYIYGKNSRRTALLKIRNERVRIRAIDSGLANVYNLGASSDDTLWMIQPGKTASSTLEVRLRERNVPYIKEHYLEYPDHIVGEDYREMWEERIKERKNIPLKVIAAIREPLSRDYSAFWQAYSEGLERALLMPILDKDFQQTYNNFIALILKGRRYTKEKLGVSMPNTWSNQFQWLDEQIKEYLDIDVFQYPFDQEKGYINIKKGNIELLLFKVEKMESILDEISSFSNTTRLSTRNINVAEHKSYGLAYSQFRKEVKLPWEYVSYYYYKNPKMDHFYSKAEKEKFLEQWRGNINGTA